MEGRYVGECIVLGSLFSHSALRRRFGRRMRYTFSAHAEAFGNI